MFPHERVNVLDRVAAHDGSAVSLARVFGLLEARVNDFERPEERLELRGEALECRDLRRENGVSSRLRLAEQEERRQAGRLQLVRDVRVPRRGCEPFLALEVVRRVGVTVDEMQLRIAFWVP